MGKKTQDALFQARAAWKRAEDLERRVTRITDRLASAIAKVTDDVAKRSKRLDCAADAQRQNDQSLTCVQQQVDAVVRRVDDLAEAIGRLGGDINNHDVELDDLVRLTRKIKDSI